MTRLSTATLAALTVLGLPALARAQGTLSTQGFGYPAGQISTRSLAAGGSIAEFDPLSATNPAALTSFGSAALYLQAEPEYRNLRTGTTSERGMIARHPLVAAVVPITSTIFGGLSLSNFLDRSFETSVRGTQLVGDSTIAATNFFKSNGAIGDVRLSLAWAARSWLRLGVAAHAITGDNQLSNAQRFDDSTRFAPLVDTSTVTYVGSAVSAGFELFAGSVVGLAGSYRKGGGLTVKHGDETLGKANVPDRISISAAFLGIKGTSLAVRTSKDTWTRMRGLGSVGLPISDSWDTSVGADILGPRIGSRSFQLRGGARWRTLPFGLPTSEVKEKSYSFGLGTLLARGRVGLDLAGIRASRVPVSNTIGMNETAWTASIGVTVRP
ncbi:MAG: hypothetical protein JWL95_2651 [Gemmatimonadetes bacterium]|nr:hypothetical protein [Gemmatimonadota bacterium]